MQDIPARLIDPVCGMTVDGPGAAAAGLTVEYEGRTYAFCRPGCRQAFLEGPAEYVAVAVDVGTPSRALPIIDEGIRRWYESCSCCLGDTYPEIKAALDAERAAAAQSPVAAGICETVEGGVDPAPVA